MTDFFKSAFDYLGSQSNGQDNNFVGQCVELGNQKLRVKKVIAEGGFGVVYIAEDLKTYRHFALKRLLANDEDQNKKIILEINLLKKLSGHPNIMQFISAASIDKANSDHGQHEYLILTEYCSGGDLDTFINSKSNLSCSEIVNILYQLCRAVMHMHRQKPAIIHRDLKIANLLVDSQAHLKLCDFGSSTTEAHYPDMNWTSLRRRTVEEEIAENTTPMYRAPEMLDLYQNLPINEQSDIWAIGCILYSLCFKEHPFSDSAKLRIINANYTIPCADTTYVILHDLIR